MLQSLTARLRLHPEHARILHGLVTVATFVGVAKVAGGLREMAVAARYGVSPAIDGYVLLLNLIGWPAGVWTSVMTTALVPLLIQADYTDPAEARRFRSEAFGMTLIVAIIAGLICFAALSAAVGDGQLGAAPSVTAEALRQIPLLSATLAFGLAYSLLAAYLMAGRSYVNSLLDGVPALVICIAVAAAAARDVPVLLWATAAGAAIQAALSLIAQTGGAGALRPRLSVRSRLWPTALRSSGLIALGQAAMSATVVLDQLFAARIGPGSNSTLGYSTRLTALAISLGAISVSRALLPALSQMTQTDGQRRLALQWTGLLFLGGAAAALVGWLAAPTMIRLLYQHGQFTARDTAAVSGLFQYSLIQIPFYFAGMVMVQLLASTQRYRRFLLLGLMNFAIKAAGLVLLVPSMGIAGIVLSTALMYCFSTSFLVFTFAREARA